MVFEPLAPALIRLYAEALQSHVPPLTSGQRQQRAENDVARLLEAVARAGYRLSLHKREQGTLDLEEGP